MTTEICHLCDSFINRGQEKIKQGKFWLHEKCWERFEENCEAEGLNILGALRELAEKEKW